MRSQNAPASPQSTPEPLSIEKILTTLENEVARDITKRITQHTSGRSPKSSHYKAKAQLVTLIEQYFAEVIGPDIDTELWVSKWDVKTLAKIQQQNDLKAEQRTKAAAIVKGVRGE